MIISQVITTGFKAKWKKKKKKKNDGIVLVLANGRECAHFSALPLALPSLLALPIYIYVYIYVCIYVIKKRNPELYSLLHRSDDERTFIQHVKMEFPSKQPARQSRGGTGTPQLITRGLPLCPIE